MLFGVYQVFMPEFLLHDDPGMYYRIQEQMPCLFMLNRDGVWAYWYHFKIPSWITYENVYFGRFLVTFLVGVNSFLLYYINKRLFKLKKSVSVYLSVVAVIMPGIVEMVVGVNISYPVRFMPFAFSSIIFFDHWLRNRDKVLFLLLGLLFYWFYHGSEIAIFTFPAFCCFILIRGECCKWDKWMLVLSIAVISVAKYLKMTAIQRKTVEWQSVTVAWDRFVAYCDSVSLFNGLSHYFVWGGYLLFGSVILYFVVRMRSNVLFLFWGKCDDAKLCFFRWISFMILWSSGSLAVFVLMSPVYQIRYGYYSGFVFSGVASLGGYLLLSLFRGWVRLVVVVLCLASVFVLRISNVDKSFLRYNRNASILRGHLGHISFPEKSQIVVFGWSHSPFHGLGFERSSGQLMYLMNNDHITGLLVPDSDFYNNSSHFNDDKGYAIPTYASGLDEGFPLFLYDVYDGDLKPVVFMLDVVGSSYKLYKTNSVNGGVELIVECEGIEGVCRYIFENNINPSEVAWFDGGDYMASLMYGKDDAFTFSGNESIEQYVEEEGGELILNFISEEVFQGDDGKIYDECSPPMPLLSDKIKMYQLGSRDIKLVLDGESIDMPGGNEGWNELRVLSKRDSNEVTVFYNGVSVLRLNHWVDLSGKYTLGRGYKKRYWKGKINFRVVDDD